jgi:ABC-type transport system involved in multi-copper enzyme maturation permease subunit
LTTWESVPERAPSVERADTPFVARIIAMVGLFLTVLGLLAMIAPSFWRDRTTAIPPTLGFIIASFGLTLLLYHVFIERDLQFRRLYGFAGIALLILGTSLRVVMQFRPGAILARPAFTGVSLFFLIGVPALCIGLVFIVAVLRNETDQAFKRVLLYIVGGLGAAMIAFCLLIAAFHNSVTAAGFMAGEGFLLMLLGLFFVGAFIGMQDGESELGFRASLGLGLVGIVGIVIAVLRSVVPESNFVVPGGIILIGMSLIYLATSLSICVDWPFIVLARRELAAYFYSPIAYLVLIGIMFTGWVMFFLFVNEIIDPRAQGFMFEPIIGRYVFHIWPVVVQMFIVPVLTMRLLSEEKRSGSLEVLLTAPVNEISIVMGKFLGCWLFYMLTWLPFWLFLVSLRYMGGEEFDYRPVLSFMVAVAVISGGLLSMGLFFSSLTSNQIIAAVLTFVGVIAHLLFYIIKFSPAVTVGGTVHEVLTHINFYDLWQSSLSGIITPRLLVFHVTVTVFFLFATVKVLESRKWK